MMDFHGRLLGTLGVAALLLGLSPVLAQTQNPEPSVERSMPSDIDPQSGFRLPLPRREDLDEAGKRTYDRGTTAGASLAGLQGPAGVQLYTKVGEQLSARAFARSPS